MKISDAQIDQLSALVDGESSDEERCDVLGAIIESSDVRQELQRLVDLRQVTGQWRNSRPSMSRGVSDRHELETTPERSQKLNLQARGLSGVGYLTATIVGGLLVCIGLLLGRIGSGPTVVAPVIDPDRQVQQDDRQLMVVQPQQQRHAAEVFAFHESVAGPLSWFVSDEDEVLLGSPVVADVVRQPVAVQLRIRAGTSDRHVGTYLVICRDKTRTIVDLPVKEAEVGPVRLALAVEVREGAILADYSMICGASSSDVGAARIAGKRLLGIEQRQLGQVFLNDRSLLIDAAAWALAAEEPQL